MHIARLRIERVRNLTAVSIDDLSALNVLYGSNGSGKTSLLEAIYLLATGRACRSGLIRQVIAHGQRNLTVYAEGAAFKAGMQKQRDGEQQLRLNGESVASHSAIARLLPVQMIDPDGLAVLDAGSKPRRQLLDWLMFHVEAAFHASWLRYQRVLQQRNSLLKQQPKATLLDPWDHELAQAGEQLHQLRQSVFAIWQPFIARTLSDLLPDLDLRVSYHAGFNTDIGLLADLHSHRGRDLERGHTSVGAHRADFQVKTPLGLAEQTLSRGQKKLLVVGLRLSQLAVLHERALTTVVLLDDITAELDLPAQRRLLQQLKQVDSQVFLTTLDVDTVQQHCHALGIEPYLLRVQQGNVFAHTTVAE